MKIIRNFAGLGLALALSSCSTNYVPEDTTIKTMREAGINTDSLQLKADEFCTRYSGNFDCQRLCAEDYWKNALTQKIENKENYESGFQQGKKAVLDSINHLKKAPATTSDFVINRAMQESMKTDSAQALINKIIQIAMDSLKKYHH